MSSDASALGAMPPCVLQAKQKNKVQTVVLKVVGASSALLDTHHKSWLWNGGCAAAHVEISTGEHEGQYLVLTNHEACSETALAERVRKGMEQLPGNPRVEWARPLTRRLQRLFCWGDAAATREDVARATKAGDLQELKAIMPQARVDEGEDLSQMPALFEALSGNPPALQDCKHDFYTFGTALGARDKCAELKEQAESKRQSFDESSMRRWLMKPDVGRCSRDASHSGAVWRCTSCRLVLCSNCALCQRREQKARDAVDELKKNCVTPEGVQCEWRQHPERPLPFFVTDQIKVSDEEKVIWIRQELGSEATLPEFCAKYRDLFGDRKVGAMQQKGACLKLYALYRPGSEEASWAKEGALPPREMEDFQRVWDPTAPSRCYECRKPLEGTASIRDPYCSSQCRNAGFVVRCTRCTPEQKCNFCRLRAAPVGPSKIDQVLRENAQVLKRWRETMGHATRVADPDHELAWKKRRRS